MELDIGMYETTCLGDAKQDVELFHLLQEVWKSEEGKLMIHLANV